MGDAVDSLCVIRSGTVLLERHGVSRALGYCDYFGEGAVAQVRVRVRVRVRLRVRLRVSVRIANFAANRLDESRQPLDLSATNSWSRRLGEVSP